MSEKIRFHLDENADPAIALGLRRYGIDVTTTNNVGLRTQSDEVQLGFIQKTQRVLFTQDTDFLIIASRQLDIYLFICNQANTSSTVMIKFTPSKTGNLSVPVNKSGKVLG
ncbi:DUF5615 family PIN-like protein [Anabaena sp. AL93]|uniref:DUF5615 family PIN-like protein n=1 Tax=Anabaena sp. AL93 TaxID=1678133 RepID=UPI0025C53205|nr:DUF5615 family PIN-like protein [Anabaena sp. AL93]